MKVLLVTHGTRGDVQPYLALARGLMTAGHEVTLMGPQSYAALAGSAGVPYVPLVDGPLEVLTDPVVLRANEDRRGLRGIVRGARWLGRNRPYCVKLFGDLIAKTKGQPRPDVVAFTPWVSAHHLAEWLQVPAVPVCFQPGWVPTPDLVNPLLSVRLPSSLSRASYACTEWSIRTLYGSAVVRRRRQALDLPGRDLGILSRPDGRPATVLQAFDPSVLPGAPRYPATTHTTGFWHLPTNTDWHMPPSLRSFLEAGERPVYIGFGSMVGSRPTVTSRAVLAAVRKARVRAVMGVGRGGVMAPELERRQAGDDVFFVDEAPHERLFPHMAAIAHHGGAGTTASALRSGRPQIVCPFMFDQPFWAQRMHALGLAPQPLPQYDLTVDRLAESLHHAVRDTKLAERAHQFGLRTTGRDGVAHAVEVLETVVNSS
ncbi:glycosyltransferase [Streptomyces sp. NPDC090442]|uniref:glycosyltransferase n=1 Tax=Streptomyces sp. NPDC090442 TaxID=3365962 RepID=UPI00380520EC